MNSDEILNRLFRAARTSQPAAEMPFGFDTRVLAVASHPSRTELLSGLIRRTAIVALAVIAAAMAGVLRDSAADRILPTEYTLADRVIQSSLSE